MCSSPKWDSSGDRDNLNTHAGINAIYGGAGNALYAHSRNNKSGNGPGPVYEPPYESEIDKASHTAMKSRLERRRRLRGQSLLAQGAPSNADTYLPYAAGKDTLGS